MEPRGDGTVVKFTDAMFGHVSEKLVENLESGWKLLLVDGLKKFVEES